MARQTGQCIFVGTRYGCTGYVIGDRVYLRLRSSLSGKRWRKDAAFARSRAAAASFGDVAAAVGYWYRRLPKPLRGLMDAGAYHRMVGAVVRERKAADAAHAPCTPLQGMGASEGGGLGFLRGMDLSYGQPGWAGMQLVGMDGNADFHIGATEVADMDWCVRVGVAGLGDLAKMTPGLEARVRLVGCRVSVERFERSHDRPVMCAGQAPFRHCFATDWVGCGESGDLDTLWMDLGSMDGRMAGRGYVTVVGVEVAVRPAVAAPGARSRRWRRLRAACKVWVVEAGVVPAESAEGGEPVEDLAVACAGTAPCAVVGLRDTYYWECWADVCRAPSRSGLCYRGGTPLESLEVLRWVVDVMCVLGWRNFTNLVYWLSMTDAYEEISRLNCSCIRIVHCRECPRCWE